MPNAAAKASTSRPAFTEAAVSSFRRMTASLISTPIASARMTDEGPTRTDPASAASPVWVRYEYLLSRIGVIRRSTTPPTSSSVAAGVSSHRRS